MRSDSLDWPGANTRAEHGGPAPKGGIRSDRSRRRVLLLGNPRARQGELASALVERLERLGLEVIFAEPDGIEALDRTIRSIGPEVHRIVIAGGDGSIAAALPALLDTGTPLVVLPLGTANDTARNLELPADQADQLALAAGGRVGWIDIGLANGRPFLNAVSLGIGAAVAALHRGEAKRYFGILNYLRALYLAFRRIRPFNVQISADGVTHHGRFVHLAVVNGRFHGGGLEPNPSSNLVDGLLDLYAVKGGPVIELMRLLAALRIKGAASEQLFRLRARRLTITTNRPRSVNVDGELALRTPLQLSIMPKALAVVVPIEAAALTGPSAASQTPPRPQSPSASAS